jgi:hypothetical protein
VGLIPLLLKAAYLCRDGTFAESDDPAKLPCQIPVTKHNCVACFSLPSREVALRLMRVLPITNCFKSSLPPAINFILCDYLTIWEFTPYSFRDILGNSRSGSKFYRKLISILYILLLSKSDFISYGNGTKDIYHRQLTQYICINTC